MPRADDARRTMLGLLALAALATAAGLFLADPATAATNLWLSIALRCGSVLAALWLAFPQLERLPQSLLWFVVIGVVAVALVARTKALIPVTLGLLAALMILRALKPNPGRRS